MPDPFKKGKYGKYNSAFQGQVAMTMTTDILDKSLEVEQQIEQQKNLLKQPNVIIEDKKEDEQPEIKEEHPSKAAHIDAIKTSLLANVSLSMNSANKNKEFILGPVGLSEEKIIYTFNDDQSKNVKDSLIAVRNHLREMQDDPKWSPIKGSIKFVELVSDPEKGSYTEAIQESPYLAPLKNSTNGGPLLNQYSIEELQADTGKIIDKDGNEKPGPLKIWDDYYGTLAGLFEAEYKKQDLAKNYSEQAEKECLDTLSQAFTNTIEAYEKCEEFVKDNIDENGKTPFDKYFNNGLYHLTDQRRGSTGTRGAAAQIGHLRGQKQAIDNGWGVNELPILGSVGEIEAKLRNELHLSTTQYLSEAKSDEAKEEVRNHIKETTELIEKLEGLKELVWDRKVESDIDKLEVSEQVGAFIDQNRELLNTIMAESSIDRCERFIEKAKKDIRERHMEKEALSPNLATEKDLKDNAVSYLLTNVVNNAVSETFAPELYEDMLLSGNKNKLGLVLSDIMMAPEHAKDLKKQFLFHSPVGAVGNRYISRSYSKEANEVFSGWIKDLRNALNKKTHAAVPDKDERFGAQYFKLLDTVLDTEKGDFLQAVAENIIISNLWSTTAAMPNLLTSVSEVPLPGIKKHLTEVGILPHVMDFAEGISEVIEAEYFKQKNCKDPLDKKSEKKYFAMLTDAYDKCIKSFEELEKLPYDVQNEPAAGGCMGNELAQITGVTSNDQVRDARVSIESMRWQKIAMQNGWSSKDLSVMASVGYTAGSLEKQKLHLKCQMEHSVSEDTKREFAEKLTAIAEWEKNHFAPLADILKNKKIKSPEDLLDITNLIKDFKEKHANSEIPEVKAAMNDGINYASDIYNKCRNDAIDEITKNKSLDAEKHIGYPEGAYIVDRDKFAHHEVDILGNAVVEDEVVIANDAGSLSKQMSANLRSNNLNSTFTTKEVLSITQAYIKDSFLASLNPLIHPEYFDQNNPRYEILHRALNKEVETYAKDALGYSKEMESKELENGIVTTPKLKEKLAVNIKTGPEIADFLEHGNHRMYFKEMLAKTDAKAAKLAYTDFRTCKSLSAKNLKSLEEAYNGMKNASSITGKEIYAGARDNLKALITQKKALEKMLIESNLNGTPVDTAKINRILETQEAQLAAMKGYLDAKKARKDNNQSLGRTGDKRYAAMTEAYKTLTEFTKLLKAVAQNPLTPERMLDSSIPSYHVDYEGLEAVTKVQSKAQKEKQAAEIDELLKAEEAKRDNLDIRKPTSAKEYLKSAVYTLYLTNLKENGFAAKDNIALSIDSEGFANFHDKLLYDGTDLTSEFRTRFERRVLEGAQKNSKETDDILDFRDDSLKSMYVKASMSKDNKRKAGAVSKIDRFAKFAGAKPEELKDELGIQLPQKNVQKQKKASINVLK